MNLFGNFTSEKPSVVLELEAMLGISFNLYRATGSLYGEYKNKKIRLSNHPSNFVENKKGEFDFNYNEYTALSMYNLINEINIFKNYTTGDYIKHNREDRVGKCYFVSYNAEKKYVEVKLETGEIKKYDYTAFI